MANIQDVARGAGVSATTVSNYLNGRTSLMRSETLARIEKAIADLKYRPSLAARQLKSGRAPLLGVLVPSMANPMYALIARELEVAAQERHGLRVLIGNTHRDPEQETHFIDDLMGYGVRGLIVISSSRDEKHLEDAAAKGMAIVSYDRPATPGARSRIDHVSVDNHASAREATRLLVERGHRRLAFVMPAARTVSRDEKARGFLDAAGEAGLQRHAKVVQCGAPNEYGDSMLSELGRAQGRAFARAPARPTGVVAVNDLMALGLIAGLRDAGLSVPDDVSIVGMDDIFFCDLVQPPLTTIRVPVPEIAQQMVERVVGRMSAPELPVGELVFQPSVRLRGSVTDA